MVYNAITSNKLHAATIHGCFMTWFIVILNRESRVGSQESGIGTRESVKAISRYIGSWCGPCLVGRTMD